MAKRVFQVHTYTPTPTADGVALTNNTYQGIEAGSAAQYLEIVEVYIGGQAAASSVSIMQLARSAAFATTPTALTSASAADGPMRSYTLALATVPVTYVAASTGPIRNTTAASARLNLGLNGFGGIVRWVAAPGEEFGIYGTSVSQSGSTLSAYTGGGTGAIGSHLVYEPF